MLFKVYNKLQAAYPRSTINYFVFNEYENVLICPNNKELTHDEAYLSHKKKRRENTIKLVYSNPEVEKITKYKRKCTKKITER